MQKKKRKYYSPTTPKLGAKLAAIFYFYFFLLRKTFETLFHHVFHPQTHVFSHKYCGFMVMIS